MLVLDDEIDAGSMTSPPASEENTLTQEDCHRDKFVFACCSGFKQI